MKKTLLITLEYPPQIGGVANYYANLCAHLPADKIMVLAPKIKDKCHPPPLKTCPERSRRIRGGRGSYENCKIYRRKLLFHWFWPKWLLLLWHAWRIAKKEKVETILVGQVLPIGTIALVLAVGSILLNGARMLIRKTFRLHSGEWSQRRISYFVFIHGMDFTWAQRRWRKGQLLRLILKNAHQVITTGEFNKKMLLDFGVTKDKVVLVHPCPKVTPQCHSGLDPESIPDLIKKYNLQNKKILLTVGRLVERKGIDMVIKALPQVLKKVPNLVYVVVGEGQEKEKLRVAGYELRVTSNLIFTGAVSDDELTAWYRLCHVFIMTSRQLKDGDFEGFGIVYLEAASFAKPVIAGRSGGVEDAVIDGVTGLLVDPQSPNEIAEAIIKLFTNKELAQKLGSQGRERVEKEFQWPVQAKILEKLLE